MRALLLVLVCVAVAAAQVQSPPGFRLQNQGSDLGQVVRLNCAGAGVACAKSGTLGTLSIPAGAPTTSKYLLQQADAALPNAQNMSALGTGLVTNTTGTGVQTLYGGTSCPVFVSGLTARGGATCGTNASTATALAASGSTCATGSYPIGVDAGGNALGCTAVSASLIAGDVTGTLGGATVAKINGVSCLAGGDCLTQYCKLVGRPGGQVVNGSTLTNENLTLSPNAADHVTGTIALDGKVTLWPDFPANAGTKDIVAFNATTTQAADLTLNYVDTTATWNYNTGASILNMAGFRFGDTINANSTTPGFGIVPFVFANYMQVNAGTNLPISLSSFYDNATLTANSGVTVSTGAVDHGFSAAPTFKAVGTGSLAVSDQTAVLAQGSINAGATGSVVVTTRRGLWYQDIGKNGGGGTETLTNQIGLDVDKLTKASTMNLGLRNAAPSAFTPSTVQSFAVNSTITVNATVVMVSSTAAGLTHTLSTTNAQDGQIVLVIGTNTANAFTLGSLVPANKTVSAKGSALCVFSATLASWVAIANQ